MGDQLTLLSLAYLSLNEMSKSAVRAVLRKVKLLKGIDIRKFDKLIADALIGG
ncbi:hypothetical protein GCM10010911_67410 [Paenibacillus nasutitermitis]|uniref:Uncharacterized protein n=1 Tax=Paenibacillus nasutitermitis TaxID=1652958 RepID=A0A916ZI46_9BACL|nr:hypothetical protein GCM10010911_67410 [Paenibacillus nasutitermitis]